MKESDRGGWHFQKVTASFDHTQPWSSLNLLPGHFSYQSRHRHETLRLKRRSNSRCKATVPPSTFVKVQLWKTFSFSPLDVRRQQSHSSCDSKQISSKKWTLPCKENCMWFNRMVNANWTSCRKSPQDSGGYVTAGVVFLHDPRNGSIQQYDPCEWSLKDKVKNPLSTFVQRIARDEGKIVEVEKKQFRWHWPSFIKAWYD